HRPGNRAFFICVVPANMLYWCKRCRGDARMKWLAVDYGDARPGLAGCDAAEIISSPITPQVEDKSMNKVAAAVAQAAAQRGAEGLVCGLPKNMDGTEGVRAARSRRFAQRLADAAGRPVVLWDERRTTVSAAAILAGN